MLVYVSCSRIMLVLNGMCLVDDGTRWSGQVIMHGPNVRHNANEASIVRIDFLLFLYHFLYHFKRSRYHCRGEFHHSPDFEVNAAAFNERSFWTRGNRLLNTYWLSVHVPDLILHKWKLNMYAVSWALPTYCTGGWTWLSIWDVKRFVKNKIKMAVLICWLDRLAK